MLYHLFLYLDRTLDLPGAGVFQFLTFRGAMAALLSLFIAVYFGRKIILYLKGRLIGETIRSLGPASHKAKAGTPTMGGTVILLAIAIPTLLLADLTNAYAMLILVATLWMGAIGFADDYIKVFKKNKQGLQGWFKIVGQVGLGLLVGLTMVLHPQFRGDKLRVEEGVVTSTNSTLKEAGFQKGDRLLSLSGKPYDEEEACTTGYACKEFGLKRDGEQMRITVADSLAPDVATALFGRRDPSYRTSTNIPFLKQELFNYGNLTFWAAPTSPWSKALYVLVAIFIVTAVSNGVNITDGLDGLAAGTTAIVSVALGLFAYLSGNEIFAGYLGITFIPYGGELFVFVAALVGACLGFLWYNAYPAQVFMGDTGSLALGGAVGALALMVKLELLLPILCGIFFMESLSVIIQVGYFRYPKRKHGEGRRIFRMSPLHHHFELGGWHESKIVSRFWIITLVLAILAFATLKLR